MLSTKPKPKPLPRAAMASKNQISFSPSSLSSKMESLALNTPPWLDLPNPLIENILERLPLSDYIRFGAVCPKWRSLQNAHRRRHAPAPPPMINLPWFIADRPEQDSVLCPSPFQSPPHRRLRIPLTPRYLEYQSKTSGKTEKMPACSFSFPNGWLLLDDCPYWTPRSYTFTLVNPVTGTQIQLPDIDGALYFDCKAAVSATDVLLLTTDKWGKRFKLSRQWRDRHVWYDLPFPDVKMGMDGVSVAVISSIFWKRKFYCIYLSRGLIVVDTLPEKPTVEFLEMDQSQLPVIGNRWEDDVEDRMELFLVESDGKLLLVVELFEYDPTHSNRGLAGFQVFEADFSERKRWVRVESLGDRVLLIYRNFATSLSAADIGVKRNCIYCIDPSKEEPRPWSVFDLSTGRVADASLPCPPSPSTHLMFVPSIC